MYIYKINVLGDFHKTCEKKHRYYARLINECYNDLHNCFSMFQRGCISREVYLLYYFIYYNRVQPIIMKLYDSHVISFDKMLSYFSLFNDYVKMVIYVY